MERARRPAVVVAAAIGAVLLLELGARALAPALPEPVHWPDEATAVKAVQLASRPCTDVVFVGDSVARDGLDPATFRAADPAGRVAYNAALDAASPTQLQPWLADQVLPALDPSVVVWLVTSADLNDASPAGRSAADSYQASFGGRDDLLGRLQRTVAAHVALVEHREALGDPAIVWHGLGDRLAGREAPRTSASGIPGVLGPDGEGLSRRDLRYTPGDPAVTGFVRDQLLADFTVGGQQEDAGRGLAAEVRDAGAALVVVVPPVTEEYVGLHPRGAADYADYRTAIDRLATATGAPVLDLTGTLDEERFADTHHPNAAGAHDLTVALADGLGRLGLDASRCD